MGHYSDYYAYEKEKENAWRRKGITKALEFLRKAESETNLPLGELTTIKSQYEILEALLYKKLKDLE